jgi:hypothetical protein
VSLSLIFIGIFIGVMTPSGYNASPSVMYQQGMVHICSGVLTFVGGLLLLLTSVLSFRRKKIHCSHCGSEILMKQDKYCRTCGAILE